MFLRPAYKTGPCLVSGSLNLGTIPSLPRMLRLAHCASTVDINNVVLLNTCFPSRSLESWYTLGRGCLWEQCPIKSLGTESLRRFPGQQHFIYVVTVLRGGINCVLCDCPEPPCSQNFPSEILCLC